MSFIVKGIDLPEKNKGLYFYIFNGKVEVVHPLDACEVEHTDAQAIQIPNPHGRLGDLDRFIESNECCGWIEDMTVETFNKLTPTILEAEEE